nr:hypothetical protein GCM10025732_21010 [Glycomyces mayteni]
MSRFGETVPYDRTAIRTGWEALPEAVRATVVKELGGPPADIRMAGGGFSGGFAARLRTDSGAELFVKAAGADRSWALAAYRQEARVNTALPAEVPAPGSNSPPTWTTGPSSASSASRARPRRSPWSPGTST